MTVRTDASRGGRASLPGRRRMSRTSRYAYILAKIYGILARTFVGANYRDILRLRSVTELYDRLYPGERPAAPEYQLTADLERRAAEDAVRTMVSVLEMIGDPPELLVHLLRRYEYLTVKSVLRTLAPRPQLRAGRLGPGPLGPPRPGRGAGLARRRRRESVRLGARADGEGLPACRGERARQGLLRDAPRAGGRAARTRPDRRSQAGRARDGGDERDLGTAPAVPLRHGRGAGGRLS